MGTLGTKLGRERLWCRIRRKIKFLMNPYRIVVADDHTLIRDEIKKILEQCAEAKVVGEACDGLEALALVEKLPPDMVILDISMPNLGGIGATRQIKRLYPNVKVLILTIHNSWEYFHNAILAGADGYLLKPDMGTELFSAIGKIREGEVYISPHLGTK
jgi:two-component system response regulator NreC